MHQLISDRKVGPASRTSLKYKTGAKPVETAFARLEQCRCRTIPVLRGDKVTGLLTMDNLGEFLRIHTALDRAH